MKPCMYVGESFVILPVTVESAAMSAQQSAATRFQIDQNTVVVPSTQLGFYSSQERIKTLPRVKQDWKEREQAVRVCVVCCSVTMDSSWILTKSTIIGDLTISAGAWVKKKMAELTHCSSSNSSGPRPFLASRSGKYWVWLLIQRGHGIVPL